ncbi:MAG: zinc ABC transporter substrate-binding protein [Eubacterium sp.]|nr:zinc ABC transporter substrate-binding protein [Eubacterium sp.]
MKKIIAVILCIIMTIISVTLTACSNGESKKSEGTEGGLKIVTTIFPVYDWAKNITNGTNADITMLLDSGADLHNYQPSAEDIIKISDCDLFIYVGGESDGWAEDAIKNKTNPDMVSLNLLDALGDSAKEEELAEGMQAEEEEEEEGEEEAEYDEHIWLSVKNAAALASAIEKQLEAVDAENAEIYKANLNTYTQKLSALDKEYQSAVDNAKVDTLVFGDRFPFRYLVDDYNLKYFAAFIGCSAETEASFETISFLSKKVDELGLNYVITLEGTDHKIAQTLIENTKSKNQKIISMNSMQSVTSDEVQNGADYLSIMQDNLAVLKQALEN